MSFALAITFESPLALLGLALIPLALLLQRASAGARALRRALHRRRDAARRASARRRAWRRHLPAALRCSRSRRSSLALAKPQPHGRRAGRAGLGHARDRPLALDDGRRRRARRASTAAQRRGAARSSTKVPRAGARRRASPSPTRPTPCRRRRRDRDARAADHRRRRSPTAGPRPATRSPAALEGISRDRKNGAAGRPRRSCCSPTARRRPAATRSQVARQAGARRRSRSTPSRSARRARRSRTRARSARRCRSRPTPRRSSGSPRPPGPRVHGEDAGELSTIYKTLGSSSARRTRSTRSRRCSPSAACCCSRPRPRRRCAGRAGCRSRRSPLQPDAVSAEATPGGDERRPDPRPPPRPPPTRSRSRGSTGCGSPAADVREPHRHDYHELIWLRSGRGRAPARRPAASRSAPRTLTLIGRGQVHVFSRGRGRARRGGALRRRGAARRRRAARDARLAARRPRRAHGRGAARATSTRLEAVIARARGRDRAARRTPAAAELERHLLVRAPAVGRALVRRDRAPSARDADDAEVQLHRALRRSCSRPTSPRHHDAAHYADALGVPRGGALARADPRHRPLDEGARHRPRHARGRAAAALHRPHGQEVAPPRRLPRPAVLLARVQAPPRARRRRPTARAVQREVHASVRFCHSDAAPARAILWA